MKTTRLYHRIYCLMLLGLLPFLFSCGEEEEEEEPTVVQTVQARKSNVNFTQQYPATVTAVEEVELRADVNGYITGIYIEEGQRVKKGQLLYQIDETRFRARKEQAESQLAIAKANLERAQRDLRRYQALQEEDAIAGQIYDNAVIEVRNAEQEVAAAEANLENARIDLQYASIYAPFDGTIGFSQVREGTLIQPGQTLLNTLSRDEPMGVDFFPEERYLRKFTSLQFSENIEADSVFLLRLPDGQSYPYTGNIRIIDRAVDRNTGTIQIRLSFPNPDFLLRPGLSATLIVKEEESSEVLLVPEQAVQEQMGEFSVYIVENGEARQVKVQTGRKLQGETVILDGLQEGQEVIVKGIQRVSDGAAVRVENQTQR
ncbi:efflux RND transporter periplasmic adaptor subunit [Litoribacter ruber]|uniref:Efflux RND transporter periplasmic adaptor subunit n=1 Tax=Litoribacter ruber TaxID=702568 RepID=A0AAP2CI77_9BACT|nr:MULTISPECIES: efflux RND transporter periplasmic adaptor subunit [Litoribacter]MBS9524139.1 efflux RND transporter periplasmic adaptor subunit [Litoribacter alkaliphilus]MBT0810062.1 efflux RND transporter periplasmic adaptor subunit [Litoribacter ruber]